jgi:transposase
VDEALAVSREKRRYRNLAEKRRIVEQAMQPGVKVAEIARQHGINDNLIFSWRKLYLAGRMGEVSLKAGQLLPVKIADQHSAAVGLGNPGSISIKVGRTQIRVEGKADVNALALVLERLLG